MEEYDDENPDPDPDEYPADPDAVANSVTRGYVPSPYLNNTIESFCSGTEEIENKPDSDAEDGVDEDANIDAPASPLPSHKVQVRMAR